MAASPASTEQSLGLGLPGAACGSPISGTHDVADAIISVCCYQKGVPVPAITVRNLSAETHRAIKARAAAHGRSAEAEVRAILDSAVAPRIGLGSLLAEIGQEAGGVDLQIERDSIEREIPDFT